MRTNLFILSCLLSILTFVSSCNKKDEIKPENPVSEVPVDPGNGGGNNGGTKPPPTQITIAYTIKASESTVDGAQLNIAPGSYVAFEAGTRGNIYLKNFEGAPGKPITFINAKGGQTIFKGSSWSAIKVGGCKNIRITGTGSSSHKYGIVVDGGHNSISLSELTTDFEIDHIEVMNSGFAGIMAKTDPKCDPKTWRENFVMRNVSIHHNYVHDVGGGRILYW